MNVKKIKTIILMFNKDHLNISFASPSRDSILLGKWNNIDVYGQQKNSLQTSFFHNEFSLDYQKICCQIIASFWDIFPQEQGHLSLELPHYLSCPRDKELIFFLGSFRPWHKGHSHCVLASNVDNLIITPDHNPWKKYQQSVHPFNILKIIPTDILKKCHLYTGFLGQGIAQPTFVWMQKIKCRKLALVLGDDTFMQITRWYNAEKLIKLICRIIVIPRLETQERVERQKKRLLTLNTKLIIERRDQHPYESLASSSLNDNINS